MIGIVTAILPTTGRRLESMQDHWPMLTVFLALAALVVCTLALPAMIYEVATRPKDES